MRTYPTGECAVEIRLDIERRKSAADKPYIQSVLYKTEDCAANVASALAEIELDGSYKDIDGAPVGRIRRECSCMQKKCGACAMLINGIPRLACGTRLGEFEKKGSVTIAPLRKFPPVADLIVDRSFVFETLKRMSVWAEGGITAPECTDDLAYEASRCLQCGCCLEVCPEFYAGEGAQFFGMSAAVPASRLLKQLSAEQSAVLAEEYRRHVYEGCGKSLACRKICPAGIDIERLLVSSNAAAIWKRLFRIK